MPPWTDYTWIVVCGALAAFFTAYGIGANDVANAFGSSVAAHTLTLRQALAIAAVCEFGGSVLLGGQVTRTVAGGIARLSTFERVPEIYMFGMLCALVSSGTWLLLATYLELPVSTTHSIIGAVLGFALVYGGVDAVVWLQPTDRFPFMSGMVPIILSWFTSPLLCGLATAALFMVLRSAVLRRENSLRLTYMLLPVLVLVTVFVNCFFVLNKGASRELTWSAAKCAWVSAAAAGGCALVTAVAAVPLLRRVVEKEEEKRSRKRTQLQRLVSRGLEDPAARGSGVTGVTGGGATRSSSAAAKHASRRVSSSALDRGSAAAAAAAADDFAVGGGAGGESGTALLAPPPAAVVVANHGQDSSAANAGGGGSATGGWSRQSHQQHSLYGPQQPYDPQQAPTAVQLHAVLRHSHSHSHSQVSYQHASVGNSQYGNSQYGMAATTNAMETAGGMGATDNDERLSHGANYHSSSVGGSGPAAGPPPYATGRSTSLPHQGYLKDSEPFAPANNNTAAQPRAGPPMAHSMRALAIDTSGPGPGPGAGTTTGGSGSTAVAQLATRDSADSRGLNPAFSRNGSDRIGTTSAVAAHIIDAVGTDSGPVHASSGSAPSAAAARPGLEDVVSGAGVQAASGAASVAIPSGASGQGLSGQQWQAEGSDASTPSGEGVVSHQEGSQGGAAAADGATAGVSAGGVLHSGGGGSGAQTPGGLPEPDAAAAAVTGGGTVLDEQSGGRMVAHGNGQGQRGYQPVPNAAQQPQQLQAPQAPSDQAHGQQAGPGWQQQHHQNQQRWQQPPQHAWGHQQQGWQQPQAQQQGWQQQSQGWQNQHGWQQQPQGWQQQPQGWQQQPQGWQQQQQGWPQRQQPHGWQPQAQQWQRGSSPQFQQPQPAVARTWNPQQHSWQPGQQQAVVTPQAPAPLQQQQQQQQWPQPLPQPVQQPYASTYGNQGGYAASAQTSMGPAANPFARQHYAQQPGPVAEGMDWTRKSLGWMHPTSMYGSGQDEQMGAYGATGGIMSADAKAHDGSYAGSATEGGMDRAGDGGLRHSASGVGGGGGGGLTANPHWQNTFDQLKAIVLHGTRVNVHEALDHDMTAAAMHLAAEVFDPDTEYAFRYLQVITAMCDSFSHGANDVANAVGPFCAIWYIYNNIRIDYQADLPIWILVIGGAGIVVGLATYGYNIIRAIGMRLSAITPARGFCIELATAVVVVVASNYGLPISTTHCQVGATAGMGLMEGSAGLNWVLALQFFLGWVVTLLITGLLSAALFAAGAYSPSIIQDNAITEYENTLLRLTAQLDSLLNRTNNAGATDPATWGTFNATLDAQLQASAAFIRAATRPGNKTNTRPVQHLDHDVMNAFLNATMTTYLNNSLPYIGGMAAKGMVLPRDRGT